jgi:DnaJ homolog subfamily B member 4
MCNRWIGDEGVGEVAGDVVFELEEKRHDRFVREGANLIYRKTVSVVEALVGTKFTMIGLDGKTIEVDAANQVLGGGYEKVVANKGMPKSKFPGEFGHLRIQFDVRWPTNLTLSQTQSLKDMRLF